MNRYASPCVPQVEIDVVRSSYRQQGNKSKRNPSMVYPHIQYQGAAYPDLPVGDDDRPLDVFRHPYAYAV